MSARESVSEFDKYVPRVLAEWDLDVGARPWQELDGSLCFIDISGFTNLAERLSAFGPIGAEELTDVLNRVFASMIDLAYERGAMQLKFGGDALLLLFLSSDHASQAASAAVEMRAALREASRWVTSVGRLKLRMSVGIHTGPIHLFRVGHSHHELLITGPAATATTAMEKEAEAGEIVVSSGTRDRLPAGATGSPRGDGWLLRWRQARVGPAGAAPRRHRPEDAILAAIPSALREYLLRGTTEAEHRVATVGFIRFSGVDELVRRGGPELVAGALDELVGIVQRAADAEEVTFLATDLDTNGGKIILASGVPTAREDDAGRLLRAVRRIIDEPLTLTLRIGVNRGHVFAGDVGSSERRTSYTVMGDTVNLAARLMAAAPPAGVLATPDALNRSHTLFDSMALEPFAVKGKAVPVQAYAVVDEVGTRADDLGLELPFTGRSDELERLVGAAPGVTAHGGRAMIVSGVAGVGKSRLVHQAFGGSEGPAVLTLTAEPFRSATPYRPFRDTFRRLLGIVRGDSADMARQLRDRVSELDSSLLPLLPLVGDVTHIDVPASAETAAIEPRFRSDRVADVVERILDLVAAGPLVLVAEDAHWMDEPTSQLLERLARAADRPWLVVSVRRPDPGGFVPTGADTIALEPLSDGVVEALVLAATAAAPLRPHDVIRIIERAGGNPLHLEEILRAVRETGTAEALPASLEAVVSAQIDGLPPRARRLLRCAAVLGGSFREVILQELMTGEDFEVDESTRLELDAFIEPTEDDRLRFRHALLREVAYEGLPYRRRRDLHHRAGEATERSAGAHPETVADLLALHYSRAGDHERAWRFGRTAGHRAREQFANVEAAANYELALEAARRSPTASAVEVSEVWSVLGDVREQAGLFPAALDAYRRAGALRRGDPLATSELMLKRARARERAGSYRQALRDTTSGYRRVEHLSDPAAAALGARLLAFTAVIRQAQEHPGEALIVARRAAELARATDEPWALARAYGVLDWAYRMLGQADKARHGDEALALYERLGDLAGQAAVTGNLGIEAYFDGHWGKAVELYERSRAAFLRAGNAVQAAVSGANIGELLVNQDRLDEAEPLLRDAVRVLRASEFPDGATFAEVQLARLLMARHGDLEEPVNLLTSARDELIALHQYGSALEAAVHLADCVNRAGEPAGALDLLDHATTLAAGEADVFAGPAARVRALALAQLGRHDEAMSELTAGLGIARQQGLAYELTQLDAVRADLLREIGRSLDETGATEPQGRASTPGLGDAVPVIP